MDIKSKIENSCQRTGNSRMEILELKNTTYHIHRNKNRELGKMKWQRICSEWRNKVKKKPRRITKWKGYKQYVLQTVQGNDHNDVGRTREKNGWTQWAVRSF